MNRLYRSIFYVSLFALTTTVVKNVNGISSLWSWGPSTTSSFYNTSLPLPRSYSNHDGGSDGGGSEYGSACGNGWSWSQGGGVYGFACPHMMLQSEDMIGAAHYDGLGHDFLYAVAGSSSDNDCGRCYQIQLLDAEREWRPDFKFLLVQIINSGFDVMAGQMDIFMGAGGFGYFTSCNSDCSSHACQGGTCKQAMYDTSFEKWDQAHYNDPNACYSGGIKWLEERNDTAILDLCKGLIGHAPQDPKDQMTIDSCYRSNLDLYHQNFVSTRYTPVQCPLGLTMLTGLRRADDTSPLPLPHPENVLDHQCNGDRSQGHFCITTMQDCCKPSCAWSGKGNPDPQWPRVDTCTRMGSIFGYPS
uniref:Uncharacterized protein n=1 Tax=viral metagenome TaxID=1070528 RepID=A0A6C0K6B1_9ZZZZ